MCELCAAKIPHRHPVRTVRGMTDEILERMSPLFDAMYADGGRPSIPPEKLLRAQLLQMLYSVRSERLLMEEIAYSILYRWFVGLNLDDLVWDATTFTKNRDRLLEAAVAKEFLVQVVERAPYAISQKKRKRIEECFGWLKDIALLRKLKHRGLFKVAWIFTFGAAAYNDSGSGLIGP
jgi:transposase